MVCADYSTDLGDNQFVLLLVLRKFGDVSKATIAK